ncbi:MAG: ATP-binding protein [Rhodocyclaceae bacterium]|nr:ATP-binding protein [Rhodocyclaceae bacterium]
MSTENASGGFTSGSAGPPAAAEPSRRWSDSLFENINLSWAIVGFAAFVIAVLWGAVVYKADLERRLAVEMAYRDNANLARAFEEHTIRTLKSVDQAVLFLKFQYEKFGNKVNVADYVREGMIIANIFNQIGVIDEHGTYILSSLPDFKKVYLGDRPHFLAHKDGDTNEIFISKPVLGRASGKWSIQMTRRINKKDGSFGGVVVISVDPFYFSSFYSGVNLGKLGSVSLVGRDGIVRARRAGEDVTVGQDLSKGQFFQEIRKAAQGSYRNASVVDGVPRLFSYREVRGYPLYVAVGVAEDEALAEFRERRVGYFVFAGLVTLAIVLFSAVLVALVRRQQRIAENLRESRIRAESANRMKSEFLASMSHELRTPLNGILGFAEFLRDDATEAAHREFANTILGSGRHLLELVNSILDLAKIEAGRMELDRRDEALLPLLEDLVTLHRPAAEQKGLRLDLAAGTGLPPTLLCDRTRFKQVLNNLLHNAIKFTETGSVVLAVARVSGALRFEVRDTGCGIEPEMQTLIFEKFRQADSSITRRHGGTGLGLALAKELVGLMGGRIGLESEAGVGTRVFFTLPLA